QLALLHDTIATLHRAYTAAGHRQRRAEAILPRLPAKLRDHLLDQFRPDWLGPAALNTLLRGFHPPPYHTPRRVHYPPAGRGAARHGRRLGRVARRGRPAQVVLVVDGSAHPQARVKVSPSVPVGLVVYPISGHYDVTAPQPGFAATEANSYLSPPGSDGALL